MTQFLYPPDLISEIKVRWDRLQQMFNAPGRLVWGKKPRAKKKNVRAASPFPSEEGLTALLGVAYHASLLREEARALSVRLMYRLPSATAEQRIEEKKLYHLTPPLPLSVGNLVRLGPAIEVRESALCIAPGNILGQKEANELFVWGIVQLGSDWWRLIAGEESAAVLPPNFLTVTAMGPGELTISSHGYVLVRIRNGVYVRSPLPDLDEGHIGLFLSRGAEVLYTDAVNKLGRKKYSDKNDADQHPRLLYYRTLRRILHLVRAQRHGGTLIIVPHHYEASDVRLVDRLIPKYQLKAEVWDDLVSEAEGHYHFYRLLFPEPGRTGRMLYHMEEPDPDALLELHNWEMRWKGAKERISDYCRFVASLANVDGAVLLTDRLALIGFGIEIIATSPSLTKVKQAFDPFGKESNPASIYSFGTRHRSAMRMCSSLEDCIAIVVSQDGPIRAIKRVGPDVFSWSDVDLGDQTL